jgi:hypothetical protein
MKDEIINEIFYNIDKTVNEKILTLKDKKEINGIKSLSYFMKRTLIDDKFRQDMNVIFQDVKTS